VDTVYISELKLESFKSYENVTLKFDKSFIVIIGENNIGKSTIFEALQLWKKCYDLSISAKGDKFYSKTTTLYINFEDLHFIRLSSDEDILYPDKTSCNLKSLLLKR
jgi:predicted ATP-dependent endonuclease of OLD family